MVRETTAILVGQSALAAGRRSGVLAALRTSPPPPAAAAAAAAAAACFELSCKPLCTAPLSDICRTKSTYHGSVQCTTVHFQWRIQSGPHAHFTPFSVTNYWRAVSG